MSLKNQLRYFQFIRRNWGPRLALFSLITEWRGEQKYRIHTTGHHDLTDFRVSSANKKWGYIYQPTNYHALEKALRFLKTQNLTGSFVDLGCGMGRILAVAAHFGFLHLKGVEFVPELCKISEENLKATQGLVPGIHFEILCMDASLYPVDDNDVVISFFNPFRREVMIPVVRNILASLRKKPREIYILYFNPTEKEIFLSAGFREVWYYSKLDYIDFSILYREMETA